MATNHLHRLLCLVPAARQVAVNAWVAANIDPPPAGPWFTVALSATGAAPATHYWCCSALTAAELKRWMMRLCALAGIGEPAGWDGWTRVQRKQWFLDQRAAIRTATGIRVMLADNDGVWDSPQEALQAAGLQVIGAGP